MTSDPKNFKRFISSLVSALQKHIVWKKSKKSLFRSIFKCDLRGLKWPETKNAPKPKFTFIASHCITMLHTPHSTIHNPPFYGFIESELVFLHYWYTDFIPVLIAGFHVSLEREQLTLSFPAFWRAMKSRVAPGNPLWKIHFGKNSVLNSQWYICKELRSKRIFFLASKLWILWPFKVWPRIWFTRRKFENQEIYKGKLAADLFGGPPKINRGT